MGSKIAPHGASVQLLSVQRHRSSHRRTGVRRLVLLAGLMLSAGAHRSPAQVAAPASGGFVDLGEPVRRNALYNHVLGRDARGQERYYQAYRGDPWFLLSFDPKTGEMREFPARGHKGNPWGALWASDGKLYLSTGGGGTDDMFVYDPATETLRYLGRPTQSEIVVWTLAEGADGRLYGGTYPNARLVSVDLKSHRLADHGRLSPDQKYIRTIACHGPYVYGNAGPAKPAVWAFDTRSGEKTQILPERFRDAPGWGNAQRRADGRVYLAPADGTFFRVDGLSLVAVDRLPASLPENDQGYPSKVVVETADGTRFTVDDLTGSERRYFRTPTGGKPQAVTFAYTGTATDLWAVEDAPDGTIYGTTRSPITLFSVDPRTDGARVLGDPSGRRGQVYGWQWIERRLYMATYGESRLTVWNSAASWRSVLHEDANPRYLGDHRIGRPSVLCTSPDGRHLLISGAPDYGVTGGALTLFDLHSETMETIAAPVGVQSIAAAVPLPDLGLVCLGTTWRGGSASVAAASDPRIVLYDVGRRRIVFETTAVAGEAGIVQMVAHAELVYATTADAGHLVVFDPQRREVVYRAALGFGPGRLFGLRSSVAHDSLFALSGTSVVRINPRTFEIFRLGQHPGITAGLAVTKEALYVCAGTRLLKLPLR